ncbi:MAG: hypothetical protein WCF85_15190, partial [Rhodospirillaceae bacterium]
ANEKTISANEKTISANEKTISANEKNIRILEESMKITDYIRMSIAKISGAGFSQENCAPISQSINKLSGLIDELGKNDMSKPSAARSDKIPLYQAKVREYISRVRMLCPG